MTVKREQSMTFKREQSMTVKREHFLVNVDDESEACCII